jgi:hypothetical protein
MKPSFATLLAGAAALAACRGQPPAIVRIVEPAEGAVVSGPSVRVVLAADGVEIAPAADLRRGTAHHHLFLDSDVTAPGDTIPAGVTGILHLGRGQTEFTFDSLAPGAHRIIAVLADPWHVPLPNAATDTLTVTVPPRP